MAVSGRKAPKTLSSTLSRACAEDFDLYCQPCDLDDIRQPAFGYCVNCEEHLCESCFNTHRRPRPLRHHKLLNKDDMPKSQNFATKSTDTGQYDDLTEACVKHKKEMIKFYCNDHKTLLCNVCVTLEHTSKSCQVDYIPDVSPGTVDSTEVKDTLQALDKEAGKCNKVATDLIDAVKQSNTSLDVVLAEIGTFREDVNKRLDDLEKEAKRAAEKLKHENNSKMKGTQLVCGDIAKSSKVVFASIKQLNETKKEDKLFIELKKAKEMMRHIEQVMSKSTHSGDIKEYSFVPRKDIQLCLNKDKSLGTITEKSSAMRPLSSRIAPTRTWTCQPVGKNDIKASTDQMDCMISDMIFLNPTQLLLIDRSNKNIKILNTMSCTVSHELNLDSFLHAVTSLPGGKFAVTTMFGIIQIFSFSSERIEQKKSLQVDRDCCGISYNQGRLAVSFLYSHKLQIMDMHGTVQTTVDGASSDEPLFRYPEYISTTNNDIYVSDPGMHAVIRLNWQGQLLGRFEGMASPQGIAVLDDGSLFVSDIRNDKCNILNISADCKESKIVLKDLQYPRALCWREATKTLYVSNNSDDHNSRNFINFYKME